MNKAADQGVQGGATEATFVRRRAAPYPVPRMTRRRTKICSIFQRPLIHVYMKKTIAIICLITGTLVMFIQWGAHLGSHHPPQWATRDRKSTRLNSSHVATS